MMISKITTGLALLTLLSLTSCNSTIDVAQERPITSSRPVLTRGLSGRQTDERGGQARSF